MDVERFEALARDPARTRRELENMKVNALAHGKRDFASIVDEVLRERFPVRAKKSGGKTPTTAVFRSRTEHCESGKEAYLWLVEQFCRFRPDILAEYDSLHTRAGKRSYGKRFSRDPQTLFPEGSSRHGNPSLYASIGDGWYADVNLNHDDKFAALLQLSYLSGLEYERDWVFSVLGATKQLTEHQRLVAWARKQLEELLA